MCNIAPVHISAEFGFAQGLLFFCVSVLNLTSQFDDMLM